LSPLLAESVGGPRNLSVPFVPVYELRLEILKSARPASPSCRHSEETFGLLPFQLFENPNYLINTKRKDGNGRRGGESQARRGGTQNSLRISFPLSAEGGQKKGETRIEKVVSCSSHESHNFWTVGCSKSNRKSRRSMLCKESRNFSLKQGDGDIILFPKVLFSPLPSPGPLLRRVYCCLSLL